MKKDVRQETRRDEGGGDVGGMNVWQKRESKVDFGRVAAHWKPSLGFQAVLEVSRVTGLVD